MSSYTKILYQIIFSPKNREPILLQPDRETLYKYIHGILKNKNCKVYCINGVEDHLHIVADIHPSIAVATLVKDIKLASTSLIKSTGILKGFNGWQDGYAAFTYGIEELNRLIEYVKNQEEHHRKKTFKEEYREILIERGVEFEEKYLF